MSFFSGRRQQAETPPTPPQPTPPATPRQPIGFETVLGANANLSGDLHSKANVRLDGIFEGTLEIEGNVLVGETAKITADINARNISIAGAVRGNVNGNKVQILRTGRVWGDINAKAITTEEGAFIDGKITMVSHEAAVEGFEAPEEPEIPPESVIAEPDFLAAVEAEETEAVEDEPDEEAEWVGVETLPVRDMGTLEEALESREADLAPEDESLKDLPMDEEGAYG